MRTVPKPEGHLAPIAIFAYRRAAHLGRCLDSLDTCPEFARSRVWIFVDGPRTEAERPAVEDVRALARSRATRNVTVVAQETNRGLASSIIAEVTALTRAWGRVIVIEDDLVVAPSAIAWFNAGLDRYADDDRVMQVGGYQYRVPEFDRSGQGVFQRFATTWGWATWDRAWRRFDPNAEGWEAVVSPGPARDAFDAGRSYPFSDMLVRQMTGRLDSWGIRWSWAVHRWRGLTVLPPRSLVRNDGFGRSATHNSTGALKRFLVGPAPLIWDRPEPPRLPDTVEVTPESEAAFRRGLRRTGAWRNGRIKALLGRLGLQRFSR